MKTLFSTGDRVYIPATIVSASDRDGRVLYKIKECDIPVDETICRTEDQMISPLRRKIMIHMESGEIDEVKQKIAELSGLVEKANSLMDELAEKEVCVKFACVRA